MADNRCLAYATIGDSAVVWELPSGKRQTVLSEHTGGIWSLGFGAGGKEIITAGRDGRVIRWDVTTGKSRGVIPIPAAVVPKQRPVGALLVNLSSDGSRFAPLTIYGPDAVYELATRAKLFGFPEPVKNLTNFVPDGSKLGRFVSEFKEGKMVQHYGLWDISTGKQTAEVLAGDGPATLGSPRLAAVSPDGKRLLTVVGVGKKDDDLDYTIAISLWDATNGKRLSQMECSCERQFDHAVVNNDGGVILSGWTSGRDAGGIIPQLWVFDQQNRLQGERIEQLKERDNLGMIDILPVIFPDGKRFAAGGPFGENGEPGIRIYEWPSGKAIHTFFGHTQGITTLVVSPDGKTLASGSADTTVLLWDLSLFGK